MFNEGQVVFCFGQVEDVLHAQAEAILSACKAAGNLCCFLSQGLSARLFLARRFYFWRCSLRSRGRVSFCFRGVAGFFLLDGVNGFKRDEFAGNDWRRLCDLARLVNFQGRGLDFRLRFYLDGRGPVIELYPLRCGGYRGGVFDRMVRCTPPRCSAYPCFRLDGFCANG